MNTRKTYIDILRLFAIFLVVSNHTHLYWGVHSWLFYTGDYAQSCTTQILCYLSLLFSVICKAGVPVFFMISGALLLNKQETIGTLFKQRVLRFVVFILLFCVIQFIHISEKRGELMGGTYFMNSLLYGKYDYIPVAWYLYAYLGILLMLPIARALIKGMTAQLFCYMISLQILICAVIPTVTYLASADAYPSMLAVHSYFPFAYMDSSIPFTGMQWLYFMLLGYFVEHIVDMNRVSRKLWTLLILTSVVCVLLGGGMMYLQHERTHNLTQETPFLTCYLTIPLIVIYMGAKYIFSRIKVSARISAFIALIGMSVIVVFVVENILRYYMSAGCGAIAWLVTGQEYLSMIVAHLILVICVVSVGCFIGVIAQKIPGLRWVLGSRPIQSQARIVQDVPGAAVVNKE